MLLPLIDRQEIASTSCRGYSVIPVPFCPDLNSKFAALAKDCTNLDDFVIGMDYTSYDIAIFADFYNVQPGIFAVHCGEELQAVFVKATVGGAGKYANEWLEPKRRLKYYLKSINDRFSLDYSDNKALLDPSKPPIYVFEKVGKVCTLAGICTAERHHEHDDGALWCELVRRDLFEHKKPSTEGSYEKELEFAISDASKRSSSERRSRLSKAPEKPKILLTVTTTYERNPDVIVEVLFRAKGKCERCGQDAPFIRKSDSTPYLEVHHIHFLAQGGDDTVSNAMALCPNCHRYLHFGIVSSEEVDELRTLILAKQSGSTSL